MEQVGQRCAAVGTFAVAIVFLTLGFLGKSQSNDVFQAAQTGAMVVPVCWAVFAFARAFIIRESLMPPRTSSASTQA